MWAHLFGRIEKKGRPLAMPPLRNAEADTTLAFGSLRCQQGLYEAAFQFFEQALKLMQKVIKAVKGSP